MSITSDFLPARSRSRDTKFRLLTKLSLPHEVGRLRYDQFIKAQGKPYPTADHEARLLIDEVDASSVHLICSLHDGKVLSALRLTPFDVAVDLGFFSKVLSTAEVGPNCSVILSRLVRADSMDGARSIRHIFKYCFDYCLARGWTHGLLHTSPHLLPLFNRYGWQQAGSEFCDEYAGSQVPLVLNALDHQYLKQIRSPYLEEYN